MRLDLGREHLIIMGTSHGMLRWFVDDLPPDSVVLVEEPDVIRRREVERLVAQLPFLSRVVAAEYQTGLDAEALLAREPGLRAARLVMPGMEYAVGGAARLADALGLPGAGIAAADIFSDKHRMRLLAAEAGLANPAFELVDDPTRAAAFAREHGGRCVLKPTRRSGSLGVQVLTDPEQVVAYWAETATPADTPETSDRGLPTAVLVEQVLEGREHSVELLVADGEVIFGNVTDKRVQPGRRPVETGHTVPSLLPDEARRALLDAATRLARAAGFGTGVLHSEWMVADGRPTLIECAARLPGDMIPALISIAHECGFLHAYLRTLRGERPVLPTRAAGGAAVEFLLAPPGTVTGIDGVRAASRVSGVLHVQLDVAPGATVGEVTNSLARSGYVLVWGSDATEATAAAGKAAEQIQIITA
ncbi:ATP-grasp domain-containing protein [Micromonospora costi]|uniref:ATP-grasp domain-containing protein n=1 Tax=Micromonospora costi TaxID=1530042 RepID=UPI0033D2E22B